jgi:glutathione synthase/RimK-type ligase-like ATP-grasp enzyme
LSKIAILYDRSDTDEQGIRYRANQQGINLAFLPFHKITIGIKKQEIIYKSPKKDINERLKDTNVIINRTQSKQRRIYAATILEAFEKQVLNTLRLELYCKSKIRTLLEFWKNNVNIPDTFYFPCNVHEKRIGGGFQDNSRTIISLLNNELKESIVIKSDEGTHGKGIYLADSSISLQKALNLMEPSVINPVGVVAQELVNKWFYDLRIIVEKRNNGAPFCHSTSMARGGFKDFRTNAYLGNMIFRVALPKEVKKEAVKCGEAIGKGSKSWIIALDAMPNFKQDFGYVEEEVKNHFKALEPHFENVQKVKSMKHKSFQDYTRRVENAFESYMTSAPYTEIQSVIKDTLNKSKQNVLFHEANACPDFWENTRIVGGVDIAISILRCAESLITN